jgi:hypothetical protein
MCRSSRKAYRLAYDEKTMLSLLVAAAIAAPSN